MIGKKHIIVLTEDNRITDRNTIIEIKTKLYRDLCKTPEDEERIKSSSGRSGNCIQRHEKIILESERTNNKR